MSEGKALIDKVLGKTKVSANEDPVALADEIKGDLTTAWKKAKHRLEAAEIKAEA